MQNDVSNISFTSNIRFISNKGYNRLESLEKTKFVQEMFNVKNIVTVKKNAATSAISYCIAGTKGTPCNGKMKHVSMFHWFPSGFFEKINDASVLLKMNEILQKFPKNEKIKGLIIGGLSQDCSPDGKYSLKLFKFLKQDTDHVIDKDYTIMFSQTSKNGKLDKKPELSLVYCKKNDTYYVNCVEFRNNKAHDLLDKNEIRDHFEFISPSNNDKFFIGNEQIPNEFLKKNDLAKKLSLFFPFP